MLNNRFPTTKTNSTKVPRPLWPLGLVFAMGTAYLISKSTRKTRHPASHL